MNYIHLSPHFPPNYSLFSVRLREHGVNVLGLGDESFENLDTQLRSSLTDYYKVDDLHNYDQLMRGVGYFINKYGKIDGIDSHIEYWLETEAELRDDFNIDGIRSDEFNYLSRKSSMKKIFLDCGLPVAQGKVIHSQKEAEEFISEVGYPVVVKPDKGVGAIDTFKLETRFDLENFFKFKPPGDFIFEEFIEGKIVSFDGIVDSDSRPIFFTSHQYSSGVMEIVNDDTNVYYFSFREIPEDLINAGKKILKYIKLRKRFFHLEFFRTKEEKLIPLEINLRPPGGLTTDMFNYACDVDIYKEWATVITQNSLTYSFSRKYHVTFIGRKYNRIFMHSHDQILHRFSNKIVYHGEMPVAFSRAMGNYAYIVRSPELEEVLDMTRFILE
ncbi:MAG: ATP-grasp domain-containing protein [Ignavibacteria bacterium]|nr:ATP-grasp domain-containing protein [Ignavibacteria bacterium]